jgi:hypothetical protein
MSKVRIKTERHVGYKASMSAREMVRYGHKKLHNYLEVGRELQTEAIYRMRGRTRAGYNDKVYRLGKKFERASKIAFKIHNETGM